MTALVFGQWLNEQIIKPVVVAWLWLVFYLTHLPQRAVWGVLLALLGLAGIRALGLKRPQMRRQAPPPDAKRPRGPVSQWQQVLELALHGSLYRHKLRGQLLALAAKRDTVSTTTARFLETLKRPRRLRLARHADADTFSNALNRTLDELAPNGDRDDHFGRDE